MDPNPNREPDVVTEFNTDDTHPRLNPQRGTRFWRTDSGPGPGTHTRNANAEHGSGTTSRDPHPEPAAERCTGARIQNPHPKPRVATATRNPTSEPDSLRPSSRRCRHPIPGTVSGTGFGIRYPPAACNSTLGIDVGTWRRNPAMQPGNRAPDSEPGIHNRRHQPAVRTRLGSQGNGRAQSPRPEHGT